MFWAVSADCSPPLPVSGLAIVAEAEWMGSEPDDDAEKPPSVSSEGLGCIHSGQNQHLRLEMHRRPGLAHNHTGGHSKKSHTLAQNDNQRCKQTHMQADK